MGIIIFVQPVSTIPVIAVDWVLALDKVEDDGICEMAARAICSDKVDIIDDVSISLIMCADCYYSCLKIKY